MRWVVFLVVVSFSVCTDDTDEDKEGFEVLEKGMRNLLSTTSGIPNDRKKMLDDAMKKMQSPANGLWGIFSALKEATKYVDPTVEQTIRKIEMKKGSDLTPDEKFSDLRDWMITVYNTEFSTLLLVEQKSIFRDILPGIKDLWKGSKFIIDFLVMKAIFALEKKTGLDLRVIFDVYRSLFFPSDKKTDPNNRRKKKKKERRRIK